MLISQAGTVAGFLILAFSQNIIMLFIARIVDGIFGGQFPISKAVIGDIVPPQERPKQMTNIGVTFTLAFLIGPAFGGFLSPFGIILPALLASSVALFTFIFTAIFLKESNRIKLGVDINQWSHGQINHNNKPQESTPLWKNKKAMFLLIQYAFLALAMGVFQSTFSLFGFIRFNFSAQIKGLFLSAMGLFQVIFRAFAFNRIRTRLGDPKTAMLGLESYLFGYFLLGIVVAPWQLLLTVFFISFSGATSRGITIGFTSRSVDFRNQGKVMGLNTSLDNLSQILGPIVGGILLSLPNDIFYGLVLSILSIIPFIMSFQVLKFGYDNRVIPSTKIQPVKTL